MRLGKNIIRVICMTLILCVFSSNALAVGMRKFDETPRPSKLVYYDADGKIQYSPYSDKGDTLPDYSQVGYMHGDVPIPDADVKIILESDRTIDDDTARIQAAIDSVSAMKPNSRGLRGAVLLKKGRYTISNTLQIKTSGVVLRGEGMEEGETLIFAKGTTFQYTAVEIIGGGNTIEFEETRTSVTDNYVPVGSRTINVKDTSYYGVGDEIVLRVSKNQYWIDELGMGKGGILDRPGSSYWTVEGYSKVDADRVITAINGNTITIDAPIIDSLDEKYGSAEILKIALPGRINNCGIEKIRFESDFDTGPMQISKPLWNAYTSTTHATRAVSITYAENCWVRNVTARFFVHGVSGFSNSSRTCTTEDSVSLDPVSPILGGYRYSFPNSGQQNLVQNCYARSGRHDFVFGARVMGPNVYYNSVAENAYAGSETHQRWSCGLLYDNVTVTGPAGFLSCTNRGTYGTGQGWTGSQVTFWNCLSAIVTVDSPPMGENFAIGVKGPLNEADHQEILQVKTEDAGMNVLLGTESGYKGIMAVGQAYIENATNPAYPQSLYIMQYDERQKGAYAKLTGSVALANGSPHALIGKKKVYLDVTDHSIAPVSLDGVLLAPVRFLVESLGAAELKWNHKTSTANIYYDEIKVSFATGSSKMLVNDKAITMKAAAQIIGDRLYVPIEAFAGAIGKSVFKDNDGLVLIQSHERPITAENAAEILNMIQSDTKVLPRLSSITVNGEKLEDFSSIKKYYTISVPFHEMKNVTVQADGIHEIVVHDMDPLRKTIRIDVTDGKMNNIYLIEVKPSLPKNLNQVEIVGGHTKEVDPDNPTNVIGNAFDNDYTTSWVTSGEGKRGDFELEQIIELQAVGIAFLNGNVRQAFFEIETSLDGITWKKVLTGISGGETASIEMFMVEPTRCKYVRFIGNKNSASDWNNIYEFQAFGK